MEEGYVSIHQMTIPHPMGKMNSGKYQSLICLFFGIHLKYFFFFAWVDVFQDTWLSFLCLLPEK